MVKTGQYPWGDKNPGQKEMLLSIEGKRGAEKKKAAKTERSTGRRKAG